MLPRFQGLNLSHFSTFPQLPFYYQNQFYYQITLLATLLHYLVKELSD